MPSKKQEPEFVVKDRRRFVVDDDQVKTQPVSEAPVSEVLVSEAKETEARTEPEAPPPSAAEIPQAPASSAPTARGAPEPAPPSPLTAKERADGERAYRQSVDALDEQLRTHVGEQAVSDEFTVSFEHLLEPFYVTAMMQLGLMGQEGAQRQVDIIGARQTIDTLNYLQEKTKGNLAKEEADLLESVLYQLRLQYLEITNALARAVQNPPGNGPSTPKR